MHSSQWIEQRVKKLCLTFIERMGSVNRGLRWADTLLDSVLICGTDTHLDKREGRATCFSTTKYRQRPPTWHTTITIYVTCMMTLKTLRKNWYLPLRSVINLCVFKVQQANSFHHHLNELKNLNHQRKHFRKVKLVKDPWLLNKVLHPQHQH